MRRSEPGSPDAEFETLSNIYVDHHCSLKAGGEEIAHLGLLIFVRNGTKIHVYHRSIPGIYGNTVWNSYDGFYGERVNWWPHLEALRKITILERMADL